MRSDDGAPVTAAPSAFAEMVLSLRTVVERERPHTDLCVHLSPYVLRGMLTFVLQAINSAGMLAFGILGLRIAAHAPFAADPRARTWRVTALAFTLMGVHTVVQGLWAGTAFFQGPESSVWAGYVPWAPVFNDSRVGIVVAYCLCMPVILYTQAGLSRYWGGVALGILLAGMAFGAWMYLPYDTPATSAYGPMPPLLTAELALFLALLFLLAVQGAADRMLWGALAAYSMEITSTAVWVTASMRIAGGETWTPTAGQMSIGWLLLRAVMVALAVWRLRLARRGVYVPALLEPRRRAAASAGSEVAAKRREGEGAA